MRQKPESIADASSLDAAVRDYLSGITAPVECESYLICWHANDYLVEHIDRIYVAEAGMSS